MTTHPGQALPGANHHVGSWEELAGHASLLAERWKNGTKTRMGNSESPREGGQSKVGGARGNMSELEPIENSFKGAVTHLEEANKTTLRFLGESKRNIKL